MVELISASSTNNAQIVREIAARTQDVRSVQAPQVEVEARPSPVSTAPVPLNIFLDPQLSNVIFEVRNAATGDVFSQFPNESQIQARQANEVAQQQAAQVSVQRQISSAQAPSVPAQPTQVQTVETNVQEVTVQSNTVNLQAQTAITALQAGQQAGQPSGSTFETSA